MNKLTALNQQLFHIGKMKSDRYWLQCPDGRMLQINTETKEVLKRLSNGEEVRAICNDLDIEEEEISTLLEMLDLHVHSDFLIVERRDTHSDLIGNDGDESGGPVFVIPWIEQRWFMPAVCFCLILSLLSAIAFMNVRPFSFIIGLKEQWIVAGFLTIAVVLHELGHVAAMPRHQHISVMIQWSGPIPMISVVCNEAWKLSRWQRMRINLAGFAMDAFLCGIAGIVGLMFDFLTPWVWTFLLIHMIRMIFALCPFLPGDGYWALVDGFGQPNLWGIALAHLKNKKASMFSLYAAGRIVFIGLIWLLYGYVLHLWASALFGRPIDEIFFFLAHPAPFLILLNILYILFSLSKFFIVRLAKQAS